MPPDPLPILDNLEGTLSTAEMCERLGVSTRTLYNRRNLPDDHPRKITPAGRVPGKGDRGDVRWNPPEEETT